MKLSAMKEKARKEHYRRIKTILKSKLNPCTKISVINALTIPWVSYDFNVINWQMKEIRKMDAKTRKFLTSRCIERVTLKQMLIGYIPQERRWKRPDAIRVRIQD